MIRNPYVTFLNLIPRQSKWIGVVQRVKGDGYVYVQRINTTSEGILCASSTDVQVGQYVLLQGTTVQSVLSSAQTPVPVQLP